jgi:acyl-CoA thioesterase-1
MQTSWGIATLAALLLTGCASPDAPPERTPAPPAPIAPTSESNVAPTSDSRIASKPRIVFLGDSLTAGLGLRKEESVPSLIQAHLDAAGYRYEVINAGESGGTAAGGLSRLDWSLDGDVQVLVIELGANDGLRGNPVEGMKRNLDEIIRRARQRNIRVLLTGMEAQPNFGQSYTSEFRKVFSDLAREHDVAFMPFFLDGVAGIPRLNGPDRIHPNPEGARIIEAALWRHLEPLLEKQG